MTPKVALALVFAFSAPADNKAPKPLTYAQAVAECQKTGNYLLVFSGQPTKKVDGCIVCRKDGDEFGGTCVLVNVKGEVEPKLVHILSGEWTAEGIKEQLGKVAQPAAAPSPTPRPILNMMQAVFGAPCSGSS